MALTTLNSVKNHLGIGSSEVTEDALLNQLIAQVDVLLKGRLGQHVETQTVTEYYRGNGTDAFALRQIPVQSITGLWLDATGHFGDGPDAFAAGTQLTLGTDYDLVRDRPDGSSRSGLVVRLNGIWPGRRARTRGLLATRLSAGLGNIKVTYVCGYATVPKDLELAANLVIGHVRQLRKHGAMVRSEAVEDYAYTLALPDGYDGSLFPAGVRAILARYRNLAA